MTTIDGRATRRDRLLTAAALLLVAGLALLHAAAGPGLDPTIRLASLTLLVAGAAGAGLFLRLEHIGEPVLHRPGWRWVGAGAVFYIAAAIGGFALLAGAIDAPSHVGWVVHFSILVGLVVPVATGWVLAPREGEG